MTNQTITSFPPVTGLSGAEKIVLDQTDINNNINTMSATITQVSSYVLGQITDPVFNNQPAHWAFIGPASGVPALPTFRGLVGSDLPLPTGATIGAVFTYTSPSHQWISSLDTAGNFHSSQPAAADLSNGTTGTGAVVLANSPTLISPNVGALGAVSATSYNKVVITAPATSATLTIADGKTATFNQNLTVNGTALSVLGNATNATGGDTDIAATAASGAVLRESGSTLGFGQITAAAIVNNGIGNAQLRQSAALSVVGNATNATANVADISTTSGSGKFLGESSGTIGFISLPAPVIGANTVTYSMIAQGAALSVLGVPGGVTANHSDITAIGGSDSILRESGGSLGFGQLSPNAIATNALPLTKLAQGPGLSVVGVNTNATGNLGNIAGSANTVLSVNAGGTTLSFAQVTGAMLVNNTVGNAQLRQSAGLSVVGRAANSTGNVADITAASPFDVLQLNSTGTSLIWGPAPAGTIGPHQVTYGNIQQGAGLSVLGVAGAGPADNNDIVATASSGAVLRESAGAIGFGQVATAGIANNAVGNAQFRSGTALSVVGRSANSGGNVADIATTNGSAAVLRESGGTLGFGTVAIAGGGTGATTALAALAALLPVGLILPYGGSAAPTGWLLCYGQAVSRTTYSVLFGIISTTYGAGDGSTTFNLPDLRGRAVAGKDDMGGVAANRLTTAGSGLNGVALGAAGGGQNQTIGSTNLPAHTHAVSITSGLQSADHSHSMSFVSGNENQNHAHVSADGTPFWTANSGSSVHFTNSGASSIYSGGGATTQVENAAHNHNVTGGTGGVSANHSHLVSGNTDNGPGTGAALTTVQPTMVVNWMIFAGA